MKEFSVVPDQGLPEWTRWAVTETPVMKLKQAA
jgi:hypothetical protein